MGAAPDPDGGQQGPEPLPEECQMMRDRVTETANSAVLEGLPVPGVTQPLISPAVAVCVFRSRAATSAQLTTFHQALT